MKLTPEDVRALLDASKEAKNLPHVTSRAAMKYAARAVALAPLLATEWLEMRTALDFDNDEVSKVYDYITDGLLSKPNYFADVVIQAHEERVLNPLHEKLASAREVIESLTGCVEEGDDRISWVRVQVERDDLIAAREWLKKDGEEIIGASSSSSNEGLK